MHMLMLPALGLGVNILVWVFIISILCVYEQWKPWWVRAFVQEYLSIHCLTSAIRTKTSCAHMGLVARKPVFRVSEKGVSNQSPQLHRLARKMKFHLKFTYETFHKVNNKSADQTAWMRRLVSAFVFRKPLKTGFLALWPIWYAWITV